MAYFNKLCVPVPKIEGKHKKAKLTEHSATMNSISGNNDGHQSVKYSEIWPIPSIWGYAFAAATIVPPIRLGCTPAGVRLAAATSLCLLCTPSHLNEPSANFWVSRSEDQSQAGLSCQPLAAFQLDSSFSFPPGRLLVS